MSLWQPKGGSKEDLINAKGDDLITNLKTLNGESEFKQLKNLKF